MRQLNKNPKYYYRVRLLREFSLLKTEEAMQEILEYTRFVKEEEKELQKLKYQQNTSFTQMK